VYLLAVASFHYSGARTRPPLPKDPPSLLRLVVEVSSLFTKKKHT
jgi:hypothetical protein